MKKSRQPLMHIMISTAHKLSGGHVYERKNIQDGIGCGSLESCDGDYCSCDGNCVGCAAPGEWGETIQKQKRSYDLKVLTSGTVVRIAGAVLFGLYVTVLVYMLFFAEGFGRGGDAVYDYNLRPFQEIRRYVRYYRLLGLRTVFLNLAGNVVGFMPFGALLPVLARQMRRAWKVAVLGLEISVLVEVSQLLFQVGCFDVDDMILNTLGTVLGYLFFAVSYRFIRRRKREKAV